jgi:hypothetical protein
MQASRGSPPKLSGVGSTAHPARGTLGSSAILSRTYSIHKLDLVPLLDFRSPDYVRYNAKRQQNHAYAQQESPGRLNGLKEIRVFVTL